MTFKFGATPGSDILGKIKREIFESAQTIQVEFTFNGRPGNIGVSLNSNLDRIFSVKLNSIIGDQIRRAREEIEKEVRGRIEPEKQRILAYYNKTRNDLESRFGNLENVALGNVKLVEANKKALLDRIENEKNPLLKLALQAVKDIIKWQQPLNPH